MPKRFCLVLAAVVSYLLFLGIGDAYADTISFTPTNPSSSDALVIHVAGVNPGSPTIVFFSNASVQGGVVRLESCINFPSFSVPSIYTIDFPMSGLSPGSYSVQYWRAYCDITGQVVVPFQQTATVPLLVQSGSASAIPALNGYALVALSAMLTIGLLCLRHSHNAA